MVYIHYTAVIVIITNTYTTKRTQYREVYICFLLQIDTMNNNGELKVMMAKMDYKS